MKPRLVQRIVLAIVLMCMLIPFMVVNDVFPFFQFGMYSKSQTQTTEVIRYRVDRYHQGTCYANEPVASPTLLAQYYQRGKSHLLLQQLAEGPMQHDMMDSLRLVMEVTDKKSMITSERLLDTYARK